MISIGLVALIGAFLLPPRGDFYRRLYSAGTHQEVAISESGDSVLALTFEPGNAHRNGIFWIGGEVNSFFPPSGIYEKRALVCAGASRPKRILIIGFGGGYSTLFYKSIPDVEQIVVVELLGDIAPFLSRNIDSARMTLADSRLTYVVDDGRRYLNAFPDEKFDLISIDPLRSHTSGHNNLYSSDALDLYRSHLTPDGVLCAWMDEFHIIPHTMAHVFPYVDQYRNEFMVASNRPITYHTAYMDEVAGGYARLTAEIYGADRTVYLESASALKPFLRDQSQILKDEIHNRILRDLDPWLEYYLFVPPLKEEIHKDPHVSANFESRIR